MYQTLNSSTISSVNPASVIIGTQLTAVVSKSGQTHHFAPVRNLSAFVDWAIENKVLIRSLHGLDLHGLLADQVRRVAAMTPAQRDELKQIVTEGHNLHDVIAMDVKLGEIVADLGHKPAIDAYQKHIGPLPTKYPAPAITYMWGENSVIISGNDGAAQIAAERVCREHDRATLVKLSGEGRYLIRW